MDRNTVSLRSGSWTVNVLELRDLPSGRVMKTHYYLHDPEIPGSVMRVSIPPDADVSAEVLESWARHPDSREIVAPGKERWTFHEVTHRPINQAVGQGFPDHPPYEVVFHSNEGGLGKAALPPGVGLGEATGQELLTLISDHRLR